MNKNIIKHLIATFLIVFINSSYAAFNSKLETPGPPTKKIMSTTKNETNDEICNRLAMRIQDLKQEVRDNHNKNDVKALISFSTGVNFTTQIYLKMNCDPMRILQPIQPIYTSVKK